MRALINITVGRQTVSQVVLSRHTVVALLRPRTMYVIALARTNAWCSPVPYTWWLIARNMQFPSPSQGWSRSPRSLMPDK